jgi:hypothetical protein
VHERRFLTSAGQEENPEGKKLIKGMRWKHTHALLMDQSPEAVKTV